MKKLLFYISGFLPARMINDGDSVYLERYYLITLFGVRFYLHRFVGSDPDRGHHDHPWVWAFSIVLAGWYYELVRTYSGVRVIKWFNFLTGDTFHRVILPFGESEVWTLFAHKAEKTKPWGFLRDKDQIGIVYNVHQTQNIGEDLWWKTSRKGRFFDRKTRMA